MHVAEPEDTRDSAHSSLREKVLEHLFVGDLLRCLWRKGVRDIEVLRAEVDSSGYDIVIAANDVIRHIQLKSSHRRAKTSSVGINIRLTRKLNGCVLWILFDPTTMELGPFRWFGAVPGETLPELGDQVGRHSKGNSQGEKTLRPNMRVLRKGRFTVLSTIDDVVGELFGVA